MNATERSQWLHQLESYGIPDMQGKLALVDEAPFEEAFWEELQYFGEECAAHAFRGDVVRKATAFHIPYGNKMLFRVILGKPLWLSRDYYLAFLARENDESEEKRAELERDVRDSFGLRAALRRLPLTPCLFFPRESSISLLLGIKKRR